jgi:hypothetical protein
MERSCGFSECCRHSVHLSQPEMTKQRKLVCSSDRSAADFDPLPPPGLLLPRQGAGDKLLRKRHGAVRLLFRFVLGGAGGSSACRLRS